MLQTTIIQAFDTGAETLIFYVCTATHHLKSNNSLSNKRFSRRKHERKSPQKKISDGAESRAGSKKNQNFEPAFLNAQVTRFLLSRNIQYMAFLPIQSSLTG